MFTKASAIGIMPEIQPSVWMARRCFMADVEKITINMSVVDLGKVDLLVSEGFYSNRTDLIRTAIRNLLDQHATAVEQAVVRRSAVMGVVVVTRKELEQRQAAGEKVSYKVLGLLQIEDDISPELAKTTIESIKVLGVLRANKAIKAGLAARIE
jgi:Arc/MetJ-type ribon-helix-helix transcriptional regulator